jgi:hypothetical protein
MNYTYYKCINRPNWFMIDDDYESVLVQLDTDSIAIVDSEKIKNLSYSKITKDEFTKALNDNGIPRLLAFLQ